jgi:hypothetical protein
MEELKVKKTNALRTWRNADSKEKKMLEGLYGEEVFKNQSIFDRIQTYEDCCEETGDKPVNEAELKALGFTDDEIAYRKLKTITKAINEGHKFNMLDTDENKWFPVFRVDSSSPSGFVFDGSYYYYSIAAAGDASRLCFKDEASANFAGKTFIDLYLQFIK